MAETPDGLNGLRILIAEDEQMVAETLVEDLEAVGAEVLGPARTLREAQGIVDSEDCIHAAVLDINLRGEMIYSVADALIGRGVAIVFATGYDAFVIPERYAGILHCGKPVSTSALRRALRQVTR